VAFYC